MDTLDKQKLIIDGLEKYVCSACKAKQNKSEFDKNTLYFFNLPDILEKIKHDFPTEKRLLTYLFNILALDVDNSKMNTNIFYSETRENEHTFDVKENYLLESLFQVLRYINVSIFLMETTSVGNRTKNYLKKILIVGASSLFDNLYSSRHKNEFAYYYKKLIEGYSNPELLVTEYSSNSWRSEFLKYTKEIKNYINDLEPYKEDMDIRTIANLSLSIGKMEEDKEVSFFLEIAIVDTLHETHERLFISKF